MGKNTLLFVTLSCTRRFAAKAPPILRALQGYRPRKDQFDQHGHPKYP
jgi:hypothetical protein